MSCVVGYFKWTKVMFPEFPTGLTTAGWVLFVNFDCVIVLWWYHHYKGYFLNSYRITTGLTLLVPAWRMNKATFVLTYYTYFPLLKQFIREWENLGFFVLGVLPQWWHPSSELICGREYALFSLFQEKSVRVRSACVFSVTAQRQEIHAARRWAAPPGKCGWIKEEQRIVWIKEFARTLLWWWNEIIYQSSRNWLSFRYEERIFGFKLHLK